jgi:Bifunctional DNA primase/polymerase, N-terminal
MPQRREPPPSSSSIDNNANSSASNLTLQDVTGNPMNLDDPDLMVKCATTYIDRGWRIFPLHSISSSGKCTCHSPTCRQKGNHPLRTAGIRGATTRLRDVLDWWEDDPDANIGIATGAGLLVITIDPERHGSLDALPINPIPLTGLVTIGNVGWHLYFTYPKNILMDSQQDALGPGMDLHADGSYVVAPPSIHPSGQRFAWTSYIAPRSVPPKILTLLEPKHGWMRSDYRMVLTLMQQHGYPLTPTEIAHGLHRDYSATLKLLRRMIADQHIYQVKRGLYAPNKHP